ncbi:energy-coupling factor ABC transporter permease [Pseudoalteromonas fenneropenaei]|uniref:Energy-coupling factor ABC transporter permease n=1 Tax=Pseudoalteromonas fenneropenaei TaxID=1737459 RepID=A0ABV7CF49_9GAMM
MTLSLLLAVCAFALSIERSAYLQLYHTPARQTGVFATAVVLCLLWQIKAGILPGLHIHVLGLTAATLILGWRLGLLSATLATLLSFVLQSETTLAELGDIWLLGAIFPVYFSYGLFLLVYHTLPRHFFVYIFVCAFLAGGLTAAMRIVLTSVYFWASGEYDWHTLQENFFYFSVIMWFPEAMLNGMAITLLITYRPHWVKTFYDKEYLNQ